jgi:cytochrome c551/c552
MLLAITTTGKVVLLFVAGTFIVFSLLVSMVIPRRSPGFPGGKLPVFVVVCIALFGAQIAAVAWVTGTQEVREQAAAATTAPSPNGPTPTTAAPDAATVAKGKAVFLSSGCVSCHTLTAAGATGTVGPNLDHLAADAKTANRGSLAQYIHQSIVSPNAYIRPGFPASVMPQTFGQLPKDQLDALVQFLISASTGKAP